MNGLGIKDFWDFYYTQTKKEIEKVKSDIISYQCGKEAALKHLQKYKTFIKDFCSHSFVECELNDSLKFHDTLSFTSSLTFSNDHFSADVIVRDLVKTIGVCNNNINKLSSKYEELRPLDISYKLFTFIIRSFNKEIIEEIIKGYVFYMGSGLGNICIKKVGIDKRVKKSVNWGESNKNKQRIIDNGGIPYDKGEHPEGEKWLVFYDQPYSYWFKWNKDKTALANKSLYAFAPTRGKYSNIAKLHKAIANNPLAPIIFQS
jgi:hypothetical protein